MVVTFKTEVRRIPELIRAHFALIRLLLRGRISDARKLIIDEFSEKLTDESIRRRIDKLEMPAPWTIEDISILSGGQSKATGYYTAFTLIHVTDKNGKRVEFRPAWRLEGKTWRASWLPGVPGGED